MKRLKKRHFNFAFSVSSSISWLKQILLNYGDFPTPSTCYENLRLLTMPKRPPIFQNAQKMRHGNRLRFLGENMSTCSRPCLIDLWTQCACISTSKAIEWTASVCRNARIYTFKHLREKVRLWAGACLHLIPEPPPWTWNQHHHFSANCLIPLIESTHSHTNFERKQYYTFWNITEK
jgi:hypothetical protein